MLYLPRLSEWFGHRPVVKAVHIDTAIAWALALALVVLLGDRRGLRRTLRELDSFDADDRLWLRRVPAPQGRFNAGQKVNAALTAAFAVLFAGSGFLLWLRGAATLVALPLCPRSAAGVPSRRVAWHDAGTR